ncbi:hypothetical protein FPSE_08068 [Fusarium pseudograminearum CS3096]|uniref:Uncharacterized protein n=1 Tax=Fusarium pseudograminearum (strain CS3096) TaxID=1028729 RepID=K3VZ53_FUSPC|nr:hypothetical protein FPSE_08068 [Fusarium pseudograminearum CS3096]EKJ71800.1 hypothetical protein FPSE_08068 [Fusarium pseudograminearum CS3096]KAF0636551.1 hypothetical protein FPSE5266_08068 [Fusarium pseudograminearum]
MEKVRKTYFDPLVTTKGQIRDILRDLPEGSAHPFSPEGILLCRTKDGIEEIPISGHSEDFFYNAVDLGQMGEILLRRMEGFRNILGAFGDFQIMQAPSTTFKIPMSDKISILAVSERYPTYYDLCFGDEKGNTSCWCSTSTLPGLSHSGDRTANNDLLQYATLDKDRLTEEPVCVFISGFRGTQITRFLGTHPALMVADHEEKTFYIVPVPLDKATIGTATLCCPLVVKRDGDSLVCSILPRATVDPTKTCEGRRTDSPCFSEAISSAEFTITAAQEEPVQRADEIVVPESTPLEIKGEPLKKRTAIITTNPDNLPELVSYSDVQIIRFGTGLEFIHSEDTDEEDSNKSAVVLPCIFGSRLEGPVLLATGKTPINVPFSESKALCSYYEQLDNVVVVVDEKMTDNARNLAPNLRINALFIVQLETKEKLETADKVSEVLSAANINAVTALAGPQSLILAHVDDKFYFYRGLANPKALDTPKLEFGADVTDVIKTANLSSLLVGNISRLFNLEEDNSVVLPYTSQVVKTHELSKLFERMTIDEIKNILDDITAVVPQLQALLGEKDLQRLSKELVDTLSAKVDKLMGPMRKDYAEYLTTEFDISDKESILKKNRMLGELRKASKHTQSSLATVITSLTNMMSSQTTSKRTHDMKRLIRKTQISNNVEATKSMTFESLTDLLENHAQDMGVMLLNIETIPYKELLGNLQGSTIDAKPACALDDRILHLGGFDAGIIMEQSQIHHHGPLRSQAGPDHPILALPYLSKTRGTGSMLAWVCWDEFVNLKSPYTVRWMEKCNESHIAALRIMMRDTLSQAFISREFHYAAGSPEIGQLMGSLLMAAMSKLAGMRTSAPVVLDTAEDTVTRLMRGLFGSLMTIAGSGVRPLSMVWQLVGLAPQYDIPASYTDWAWYENVVELYPYTGWPLEQFHENVAKLLDKVILRFISKNEDTAKIKANAALSMIQYCKLRNIQLEHCRTIVTAFKRMFTDDDSDVAAIAGRLLENVPTKLEKQTSGFTKMMKYLRHLSKGGERRSVDDLVYASVYTKRSAAFKELKTAVAEACGEKDWDKAKKDCQAVLDKHKEIASFYQVEPEKLKVQNIHTYRELISADVSADADQATKNKTKKTVQRILDDAEKMRVPWQVGKDAEKNGIEPLDEGFLELILTGKKPETESEETSQAVTAPSAAAKGEFSQFEGSVLPAFISTMEKDLSAEDVCDILNVPASSMRVFIKALSPDFVWNDLGQRFKMVVLGLLENRTNRVESRPAARLLNML